jgi:hypothetical protein
VQKTKMTKQILLMLVLLALTWPLLAFAGEVNLPKTGQTTCYDANGNIIDCANTGQDGDKRAGVDWPEPRFVDNNGDGTVTDNLTGLIWLKNANRFGQRTWYQALTDCSTLASGSYGLTDNSVPGDWRSPNIVEIESLVNAESLNSATWLNSQGFINVQSSNYWSSTALVYNSDYAWSCSMDAGLAYVGQYKSSRFYIWPVRTGQNGPAQAWKTGQTLTHAACDDGDLEQGVAWPSPRFVDNSNGTVTDHLTGLIWLKNANCINNTNWNNALNFCNNLASGSYGLTDGSAAGDWRLPNRKELVSLVDHGRSGPCLPQGHPFDNVANWHGYWSSTTYPSNKNYAWLVGIGDGSLRGGDKSSSAYAAYYIYYVWPVRAGQSGSLGNLTISYPNQGETLTKGSDYTIRWTSRNITGTIQIDLYKGGTDPGHMLLQLAATTENDGEYLFNPGQDERIVDGSDYYIGISAHNGTVWDFSDTPFTIQSLISYSPKLEVSPLSHDFGGAEAGTTCSTSQEFVISNTGNAVLNVNEISVSDFTNFTLNCNDGSNPCGSTTPVLAPNTSCTVTVKFCPQVSGATNSLFTAIGNYPETMTVDVPIAGTGSNPTACSGAQQLNVNSEIDGTILTAHTNYYRVDVPRRGRLVLYTTGGTNTFGELRDAQCQVIAQNDNASTKDKNFKISKTVESGTYHVAVRHSNATRGVGDYKLFVDLYLITTSWDQEVPYKICFNANASNACERLLAADVLEDPSTGRMYPGDTSYRVGCTTIAVGQLINYYFQQGLQNGWLDTLLENTTVSPSFSGKRGPNTLECTYQSGFPTEDVYADSIDKDKPLSPEAIDLRKFLWTVAMGLNINFSEKESGPGVVPDGGLIRNALIERFRFISAIQYDWPLLTRFDDEKHIMAIKNMIDQGHPILLSLMNGPWGVSGGHLVLIDGYKEIPSFQVHLNLGWGGRYDGWYSPTGAMTLGPYTYTSFQLFYNTYPVTLYETGALDNAIK